MAIAGWLGMVIIAELGQPVLHLGPAVFLQRAGVVLANYDPHIRSPFSRRVGAVQLANPAPGQQRSETMDRAVAVPSRRAGLPSRSAAGWPGAVMSRYKTCGPAVSERPVCFSGVCRRRAFFTFPTPNYNWIKLR